MLRVRASSLQRVRAASALFCTVANFSACMVRHAPLGVNSKRKLELGLVTPSASAAGASAMATRRTVRAIAGCLRVENKPRRGSRGVQLASVATSAQCQPLDMSSESRFLARGAPRRSVKRYPRGPRFTIIYAAAGLVIVVSVLAC